MQYDVAIIGGGIVGASLLYTLSQYHLNLCLLERNNDVSMGASRANTGIIHAGFDPQPGTWMAKLNVRGSECYEALCGQLGVEYCRIGSLVLAFDAAEEALVRELYRRGKQNGVRELQVVDKEWLREQEPNASREAVCALWAPTAAVIEPWGMVLAFCRAARENGAEIFLNAPVTKISREKDGFRLQAGETEVAAAYVINAAGLYADFVGALGTGEREFTISPAKGEYYLLDKTEGNMVCHILFQCPNERGKGVVVTPTVHGNLLVGPNSMPNAGRDDWGTTQSGQVFIRKQARKSVPGLNFGANIRNFAGLRALSNREDFIIGRSKVERFYHAGGIKSPGLSAAPAIAEYLSELLFQDGLFCRKKETFRIVPRKRPFHKMTEEEKKRAVQEDPAYGHIVCRCETITEGEIVEALRDSMTPPSIDAVKRRCGSGMGRCQGGFCAPRIAGIIARERKIPIEQVLQDGADSYIAVGRTKTEDAQ